MPALTFPLDVKGSKVSRSGQPAIIAAEVKKGDNSYPQGQRRHPRVVRLEKVI